MQIGIFSGGDHVDTLVDQARQVAADGFETYWLPQLFGVDALTALTAITLAVPDLKVGTAVIPTYPRHPAMLAAQAKTLTQISGGRLVLGIGLSHQMVIEGMFGLSFDKPVRHMREYLDILLPLLDGQPVNAEGDALTFRGGLSIEAPATPVLVAALGPAMLKLAGRRADGTSTWMTGPRTIESHIAPTIRAAAEEAGRPEPQVVVSLPMCVTDDTGPARERAAEEFAIYGALPSYRAMMDREGVEGPADIALIGSHDQVVEAIGAFAAAGATMVNGVAFGTPDEQAATRAALVDANR